MNARRADLTNAKRKAPARKGSEVEQLEEEIRSTRAELGATVQALAAKVDVKSRARQKAAEVRQRAAVRTRRAIDQAGGAGMRARQRTNETAATAGGGTREGDSRAVLIGSVTAVATFVAFLVLFRRWRR